jgi:hypothetical protein
MSITTAKTPLGPITNITGEDLADLIACMERQALDDQDKANLLAGEARHAEDRGAVDAEDYRNRATWAAEDAAQTKRLYELLAGATQVDIKSEVAA